jgi:hypothetical protein
MQQLQRVDLHPALDESAKVHVQIQPVHRGDEVLLAAVIETFTLTRHQPAKRVDRQMLEIQMHAMQRQLPGDKAMPALAKGVRAHIHAPRQQKAGESKTAGDGAGTKHERRSS